jgi:hypothetical protein
MTRFSTLRAAGWRQRAADAHGTVVGAPLDVDGRGHAAHQAAVAVDVGRQQRHRCRRVALQAADVPVELAAGRSVLVAEDVAAGGLVDHALVDVHGAAGLAGDGLGHEGGEHVVAQRRLAHRALEEKDLIGQTQRVGVEEVDLHLTRAHFVDQRVHVELHLLAIVVDVLEQRVELVHRVDAVGLARGLAAPAAPHRGLERHVGVGVACHQVELQLGRHHGRPALGVEQVAHVAQHAARCKGHQHAMAVVAVVDDLGRGVGGPGHDAHGGRVGPQVHVAVGGRDDVVVGPFLGNSPVTPIATTASGSRMPRSSVNFWRGRILPRATPVRSGTRHSISVTRLVSSHCSSSLKVKCCRGS